MNLDYAQDQVLKSAAMNEAVRDLQFRKAFKASACPHDCPSTCALEVEIVDGRTIGRVRGARDNDYTAGVICAKVARYAERIHHPARLTTPLRRKGKAGDFAPVSWDDALDITAEALLAAERRYGAAAVWPYYYAGTMGLVMRDGIQPAAPRQEIFAIPSPPSASIPPRPALPPASAGSPVLIRARWRNPTLS